MYLSPGQPRAGRHPELALRVFGLVQQHATRRFAVTPGATGLLEIVLQRPRDVAVNDQPHVRLVYPHAEGIGGRDGAQIAVDEAPLHLLLAFRPQTRVEIFRLHLLHLQIFGHFLALPPGRAVDDGPAGPVRRQMGYQDLVNMAELLVTRGPNHIEGEVGPVGPAVEEPHLNSELVPKVVLDVPGHLGLGGGGQAQHRRHRSCACLFPDEAAHIAIVGAKVMAPARQAVSLVQHPAADLSLIEHPAQGTGAELLRRNDEDTCIPQANPVQGLGPFGHGQQPVDGHAGADSTRLQSRHLVGHQRDQGRDHHRQGAGVVMAGQGRDLVADGLAGAGRQNAQHVLARHRLLHDGLLQGAPVFVRRFGPKVIEAEPALQRLAGVVPFPAPVASGIGAGGVPEPAHQAACFGELMAHPGRHHRVTSRNRQPCQRVGQSPSVFSRPAQDLPPLSHAGCAQKSPGNSRPGLAVRRSSRIAELREEIVQTAVQDAGLRGGQPVPGREQIRGRLLQGCLLVPEDRQGNPGVQLRVVHALALEPSVLIVLDEAMIGIAGECQRAETQGVQRRQLEEPQVGPGRRQVRQVEIDQVVAQNERRPVGQIVQPRQLRCRTAAGMPFPGIGPHRAEGTDTAAISVYLQIEGETARWGDR